ncbi:MAG TPA: hypothetical protein VIY86_05230 [Pirellulaceae bacterium]
MDVTTVTVGLLFVGTGVFFLWRSLHPEKAAGKLKAMMETWGGTRGLWLYRVAYVGIPWFFGGTVIAAGLRNVSLSSFLGI